MKDLKGMYVDCHPADQPQGTYRYAKNVIINREFGKITSERGDYSMSSIEGTLVQVYNDNEICLLFHYQDLDGNITSHISRFNGIEHEILVSDPTFQFENSAEVEDYFISVKAQINNRGELICAFTDNVSRPRFINLETTNNQINTGEQTYLFPNVIPADFELVSISSGGSLIRGEYTVFMAYMTDDRFVTNYSSWSKTIEIFDDFDSRKVVTSKSIRCKFTGVDSSFSKIRIAVVGFIDNVFRAYEVGEYVIETTESPTISINSLQNLVEIDPREVTIDNPVYDRIKTLESVNGYLYAGNLRAQDHDLSGFQRNVVNGMNVSWSVDTDGTRLNPDILEGSNKDATKLYSAKGFMPDEVYALYAAPVFSDGFEAPSFHIPGKLASVTTTVHDANHFNRSNNYSGAPRVTDELYDSASEAWGIPNNNGNKFFHVINDARNDGRCGYHENENEFYPNDPDEFGSLAGQRVRHHKTPSIGVLEQGTMIDFEKEKEDGGVSLSVNNQGISNDFSVSARMPNRDIESEPFYVTKDVNTSVIVAREDVTVFLRFDWDTEMNGDNKPFFQGRSSVYNDINVWEINELGQTRFLRSTRDSGLGSAHFKGSDSYKVNLKAGGQVRYNHYFWYEYKGGGRINSANASWTVSSGVGVIPVGNSIKLSVTVPSAIANTIRTTYPDIVGLNFYYALRSSDNKTNVGYTPLTNTDPDHDHSAVSEIKTYFGQTKGYPFEALWKKSNVAIDFLDVGYVCGDPTQVIPDAEYGANIYWRKDTDTKNIGNIIGVQRTQYVTGNNVAAEPSNNLGTEGIVMSLSQELVISDRYDVGAFTPIATMKKIKKDIFFPYSAQTLIKAGYTKISVTGEIVQELTGDCYTNLYGVRVTNETSEGYFYLPVFSDKNIAIREYGSQWYETFYPRVRGAWHGLLTPEQEVIVKELGESSENHAKRFSNYVKYPFEFTGSTKFAFPRNPDEDIIGSYPNRIISTDQQNPEEIRSSWRSFRPNNYYELDKLRGDITHLQEQVGRIIIHTSNGAFITQGNSQMDTQADGSVFLGKGNIFATIPTPIGNNGLARQSHQFSIFGIYFYYSNRRFYIISEHHQETARGINRILDQFFVDGDLGFMYDRDMDLLFISNSRGTLSYNMLGQYWNSYHDWTFQKGINLRRESFYIENGIIHRYGQGSPLLFNGETKEMRFDFVTTSPGTGAEKSMKQNSEVLAMSLEWQSMVGPYKLETFDKVALYSNLASSGYVTVDKAYNDPLQRKGSRLRNGKWALNAFWNYLKQGEESVTSEFDGLEIIEDNLETDVPWHKLKRVKDKYIVARLIWENTEGLNEDLVLVDYKLNVR